jgi:hypothetical protein
VFFFGTGQVFKIRRTRSCCWRGLHGCREVLQRLMMWPGQIFHLVQKFRSVKMKTIKRCLLEEELKKRQEENPFMKEDSLVTTCGLCFAAGCLVRVL